MAPGAPPLRPDQYERYRRHLTLPEIGLEGQRALLAARVLLIGAGGLGCPLAQYLAAAGVGTLGLVDFDVVDALEPPAPDPLRHRRRRAPEGRGRARAASAR